MADNAFNQTSSCSRMFLRMNIFSAVLLTLLFIAPVLAITDDDIAGYQRAIKDKPVGERIALWAEKFIGTPYDPDPLGEYVTKKAIVADERVDCMYLTFRTTELALAKTPEDAVAIALDKRFITGGRLKNGTVLNYEDRFQYGEDMLDSGKWGREVTRDIGPVVAIRGSRGREKVEIISKEALLRLLESHRTTTPFKDGDFVFLIKEPRKRSSADEIVGHIGIIKIDGAKPFLIHAGGVKNKGGEVRRVLFSDYVRTMPFAGIRVSRFD